MKQLNTEHLKVGDLVKYSEKAMKVISYNSDWYEDIAGEVNNETFVVVENIDSFSVNAYCSKDNTFQKFYFEDLEKIQGADNDNNSLQE
jgi:hypothetical protein